MAEPADDTAALLERCDRLRDAPGSVELYDALADGDAEAVGHAYSRWPRHAAAPQVLAWLRARGVEPPPPPSVAEVAAEHGIDDLAGHLRAEAERMGRLRENLERTLQRAERAESVASAYAAVVLLLAAVAALGWAAALGVVPIFEAAPRPEVGAPEAP